MRASKGPPEITYKVPQMGTDKKPITATDPFLYYGMNLQILY